MGTALRRKISVTRLAKPVKRFVVKADETEEMLIERQSEIEKQSTNKKKVVFSF